MSKLHVRPVEYNSKCITFSEWVSLFTLCLAPLIAHIISGTPAASHLAHHRPKWHDDLCHYNPTSILWRYAAITDRRLRAIRWSRNDLAASNAIFWTAKGWEGGEDMVITAAPHCIRLPDHTRVNIWSATTLKTIITTLQGVSAAYSLIGPLAGVRTQVPVTLMGLDVVFFPLAILGLLRLCAATWLADDFEYVPWDVNSPFRRDAMAVGDSPHSSSQNDFDPFLVMAPDDGPRFETPSSSWPSMLFRVFYLAVVGGVCVMTFIYLVAFDSSIQQIGATSFLVAIFYIVFSSISVLLYAFYFLRGQTTSTLLPCLSRTWYKVYTFLLLISILVIIIFASIETTKEPDGSYSSIRSSFTLDCASQNSWWKISPNTLLSGVVSHKQSSINIYHNYSGLEMTQVLGNGSSDAKKYWLYDFYGYCVGDLSKIRKP